MTLNEFLKKLSKTKNGWWLTGTGCIRRNSPTGFMDCPVSAVTGDADDFTRPISAGIELTLGELTTRKVYMAAERFDECDPAVRAKLLAAVGLKERDDA